MKSLQQLRDEADRIVGEMRLLRNTVEHWNSLHAGEEMDPELYAPVSEIEALNKFIADCDRRLIQ